MTPEDQLNKLIRLYSRVSRFPSGYKEVFTIGSPMRWILADIRDQYISIYKKSSEDKIFDIDIASCFPTVCNFLFKDTNPKFLEDIAAQPSKLSKNILIANTLKETPYLKILNMVSKAIILGFVFDRQDSNDISLLEFEKDGCLIYSNNFSYYKCIADGVCDTPFLEFINEIGFKFKIIEYEYYIRCNNTSWFWSDINKLRIKGMYKHIPKVMQKFYNDVFNNYKIDIEVYTNIYNKISLKFIQENNLQTILQNNYFCGEDNKILNEKGKYEKYSWRLSHIDPVLYQKTFMFPVWVFQQRNLAGVV
jgi:hypothetical protein